MRIRLSKRWKQLLRLRRRLSQNRRFNVACERYLAHELPSALEAKSSKQIFDHYHRKIFQLQSSSGPLFCKFYLASYASVGEWHGWALNYASSHGLNVSALRFSQTVTGTMPLAILVQDWIDSPVLDVAGEEERTSGFANLARLHRIPDPRRVGQSALLDGLEVPPDLDRTTAWNMTRHALGRVCSVLDRRIRDSHWMSRLIGRRLKPLFKSPHPWGLLHMDFSLLNQLYSPSAGYKVIDLDDSCFGCVWLDLALSLLHYRFRVRSEELTKTPIEKVLDMETYSSLLTTYRQQWTKEEFASFEEHHEAILLWGYVKAMGNAASRSVDPVRAGWSERRQLRRQVSRRFRVLNDFLRQKI